MDFSISVRKEGGGWKLYIPPSSIVRVCMNTDLVGVLAGDACSDHMTPGLRCVIGLFKVDGSIPPGFLAVQQADVLDAVEWYSHCNLPIKPNKD